MASNPPITSGIRSVGDLYGPTYVVKFYADDFLLPNAPDDVTERFINASPLPPAGTDLRAAVIAQRAQLADAARASAIQSQKALDNAAIQKYISNLTIEARLGAPLSAILTLTPPYEEAKRILDSRLIRMYSVFTVSYGYYNQLRGPYYFRLTQPRATFSPRNVSITLEGIDVSSSKMVLRTSTFEYNREDFVTDEDILNHLVDRLQIKIDWADNLSWDNYLKLKTAKSTTVNNMGNDWLCLRYLLFTNGLTYTTDGNTITIHDLNVFSVKEPSYFLKVYQKPSAPYDIPVAEFSTNVIATAFYSPAVMSAMAIRSDLDNIKESTQTVISAQDLRQVLPGNPTDVQAAGTAQFNSAPLTADGRQLFPFTAYRDNEVGEKITLAAADTEDKIKATVKEAALRANINATATVVGVPDLLPPMTLGVTGMGESIDGLYFIKQATHQIGKNGYDTTLDLTRTLSTAEGTKGITPKTPPVSVEREAHKPHGAVDEDGKPRRVG